MVVLFVTCEEEIFVRGVDGEGLEVDVFVSAWDLELFGDVFYSKQSLERLLDRS